MSLVVTWVAVKGSGSHFSLPLSISEFISLVVGVVRENKRECFFIDCLDDLFTEVIGVLKPPSIVVLLSLSPFMSVSVCLLRIQLLLCLVPRYLQLLCLPLGLIP